MFVFLNPNAKKFAYENIYGRAKAFQNAADMLK